MFFASGRAGGGAKSLRCDFFLRLLLCGVVWVWALCHGAGALFVEDTYISGFGGGTLSEVTAADVSDEDACNDHGDDDGVDGNDSDDDDGDAGGDATTNTTKVLATTTATTFHIE